MRTFARFAMNRNYAARGGVVMAIGMATLYAVPPAALAQGITAVAGGSFRNVPFIAQSSQFTVEFDAIPTGTDNAGVGLSDDPTGAFKDTSAFVRFNPNRNIDARNGAEFSAASVIPYKSGLTYHVRHLVAAAFPTLANSPFPFMVQRENATVSPSPVENTQKG